MSTGNPSCLRFSLEESVWFQRGQEVAELLSISLDPDITIQENDQYVTIKGSLVLSGEYKCAEQDGEGAGDPFAAVRLVHSVTEREEGSLEFSHRFPVDITIPQNRIESIYDIDITVESFDYDFPERSSLKLSAELAITGLYGDQQHGGEDEAEEVEVPEGVREEEEQEQVDLETLYREREEEDLPEYAAFAFSSQEESPAVHTGEEVDPLYLPFSAEAKKEPEAQSGKEEKPEPVFARNAAPVPFEPVEKEPEKELAFQRKEPEMELESPAVAAPKEVMPPAAEAFQESPAEHVQEVEKKMIINEKAQQYEEESSSSSEEEAKVKGKKINKKKGLSIAEFLARKEDSQVAKIRVCIVQQEDTLQRIAERYEVSVQQLLNINHLGIDQEVSEGQVLYVPAAVQTKGSS
ncbi:stage VI sporulation protein D [Bacillus sp. FJAT-27251]|uniref:stage VI sporulation protein D n=1 Tax=Bacillus sp. FJAT-27251 TaxID=1684142 RepID=UPI0006A779AE|nr:stage VI sporulation protein D [Bacillus sp. FJAT-27251]